MRRRDEDGTAPVTGGDALAGGSYRDALSAGGSYRDALSAGRSYPDALRADPATGSVDGADALAVGPRSEALAVASTAPVAGAADPLTGYADATLQDSPTRTAGGAELLGQPVGALPPATPAAGARSPSQRPGGDGGRGRAGGGARTSESPQERPPAGSRPAAGGRPSASVTGGVRGPGSSAGRPGRPATGPLPRSGPVPPRPDAVSWAELTIRGRATAGRQPRRASADRSPSAAGPGWQEPRHSGLSPGAAGPGWQEPRHSGLSPGARKRGQPRRGARSGWDSYFSDPPTAPPRRPGRTDDWAPTQEIGSHTLSQLARQILRLLRGGA